MLSEKSLEGKVAIITGGGTGIGLAIAQAVRSARRAYSSLAAGTRATSSAAPPTCGSPATIRWPCRSTCARPTRSTRWCTASSHHYGRIDILVNNAAGNFISRAEDLSPNGWDAVIGIVLNGSFYCSRAVGRHMIERGKGGSIVSVLANYVWTGSAGTVHSAAAKAGVLSMTQTLAVEWARHRIRVNAVAPGPIESAGAARQLWNTPEAIERITSTVPLGRWGQPSEVADAVAFLVSDHASFITGETLTIDGGARLGPGTFGFLDR